MGYQSIRAPTSLSPSKPPLLLSLLTESFPSLNFHLLNLGRKWLIGGLGFNRTADNNKTCLDECHDMYHVARAIIKGTQSAGACAH